MTSINVTLSLEPTIWKDFQKFCADSNERYPSRKISHMMAIELSKNLNDPGRLSMPMIIDEKEKWIDWMQDQNEEELQSKADKVNWIAVYMTAYGKVPNLSRKNYGFVNYAQALEYASRG